MRLSFSQFVLGVACCCAPAGAHEGGHLHGGPAFGAERAGNRAPMDREIDTLRRQLEREPSATVYIALGEALMERSRVTGDVRLYKPAAEAFEAARRLEPRNVDALVGLAWVANSDHAFDEGDAWSRRALEVRANTPRAYALLGDSAVERGAYAVALEHYQKLLDLQPDMTAYSRAAQVMWLTGKHSQARWLMRKAIDAGGRQPEHAAWCRAALAMMSLKTGSYVAARDLARTGLKAAPDNHRLLNALGAAELALQDPNAAERAFRRSVEVQPSHEALTGLVEIALLQNRPADAAAQTRRVLAFHGFAKDGHDHDHPHDTQAHGHTHGHSHGHRHDGNALLARFLADHALHLAEALAEARSAHAAYPNAFATDTLAWCLYRAGKFDEAADVMAQALRWGGGDAEMYFHAGMIAAQQGETSRARRLLSRALSMSPRFHPRFAPQAVERLTALSAAARLTAKSRDSAASARAPRAGADAGSER